MADDWIQMRVRLPDDPDVIAIAAAIGRDEYSVCGMLLRFWGWADQHTADGNARSVTCNWIDRYIGVTGFCEALVSQGWLVVEGDGIRIPNFDRFLGSSGKKRLQTAKRVAKHREMKRKCNASSVTKSVTKEEKRKEEKSIKEIPPNPPKGGKGSADKFDPLSVDLPPELDRDSFRAAWAMWCDHRREIGKRLTPNAVSQQIAKLATFGVEEAVAKIETAVANGWQGVVFADSPRGSPPAKAAADKFAGNREFLERFGNAPGAIQPTDGSTDGDGRQALLG